ncbi:MAG TPA: hypothetical protein PK530_07500 [Anaerolineales bacterium]|nr:hypothetical protein [Anaerolineales bacterium]
MINGNIQLTLMIGPAVPVPMPREVMDALVSVEVRNDAGGPNGFQLTFQFSAQSVLNELILLLGDLGPIIRCLIIVTVNGTPNVLMDGTITHTQLSPDAKTGRTTLTITGEDLRTVMNLIDFTGIPYPGMPPEARIALILAKYAFLGVVPLIIPSIMIDVPIPTDRIPIHRGTDLAYINQLAEEVGYVFYVDPGPAPGTSIAYWGPQIKVGIPQPAFNANMDAHTNLEALSFSYDGDKKTMPVIFIHQQETHVTIPIPIPDISPLNPPLGVLTPFPKHFAPVYDTAHLSPIRAVLRGLAEASKTADILTASGSLNVVRYGHVLKTRGLVGVRGAGHAFDGLYFVKSVTHSIKRGEYKQSFTLTRNGLISITPTVPV